MSDGTRKNALCWQAEAKLARNVNRTLFRELVIPVLPD